MTRYVMMLLGAVCCGQVVEMHSDPKAAPASRVCVMPAEANLLRVGMKGGEGLPKESEVWADKLSVTLQRAITEAGGRAVGDLSAGAVANQEAVRDAVVSVRQKYKGLLPLMRRKMGGVNKGRFSMGDEIALLPCAAEADSIAFLNATGVSQTGARKALSALTGGFAGPVMALSNYEIWISLVNSKTGAVSTLIRINSRGGKTGSDPEEALKDVMVTRFKKLKVGQVSAASGRGTRGAFFGNPVD
jgi:hypothetical protein